MPKLTRAMTPAPILKFVANKAFKTGGVVHGTELTIGPAKPTFVAKSATAARMG